jgi:Rieske Fe-S protein
MLTRRETLVKLFKYVVSGAFLVITLDFLKGAGNNLRRVTFSKKPKVDDVIYSDGVYLVGLEKGPAAFASKCPHLGCELDHRPGSDRFRCPCHGSEFTFDGRRVKGPARTDMTSLDIRPDERGESCCVDLITT